MSGVKTRPKIGVSACLLGRQVRHNGTHKEDSWLVETLAKYVEFRPYCPEVEMGLGVPREEIHLVKTKEGNIILRGKKSGNDFTELALKTYGHIDSIIAKEELDGFILMRKSPSCGPANVKLVDSEKLEWIGPSKGLFAKYLQSHFPDLPQEDSGKMKNEVYREHFVKNVFAHYRFSLLDGSMAALQSFHAHYKYVLMEHDQDMMRKLGNLAANSGKENRKKVYLDYKNIFFETMGKMATNKNRFNALEHVMGYLKRDLNSADKARLIEVLNQFKIGTAHYTSAILLMKFFIEKYQVGYFDKNYYFGPYPIELKIHLAI